VAALLSLPVVLGSVYVFRATGAHAVLERVAEYVSFLWLSHSAPERGTSMRADRSPARRSRTL